MISEGKYFKISCIFILFMLKLIKFRNYTVIGFSLKRHVACCKELTLPLLHSFHVVCTGVDALLC